MSDYDSGKWYIIKADCRHWSADRNAVMNWNVPRAAPSEESMDVTWEWDVKERVLFLQGSTGEETESGWTVSPPGVQTSWRVWFWFLFRFELLIMWRGCRRRPCSSRASSTGPVLLVLTRCIRGVEHMQSLQLPLCLSEVTPEEGVGGASDRATSVMLRAGSQCPVFSGCLEGGGSSTCVLCWL